MKKILILVFVALVVCAIGGVYYLFYYTQDDSSNELVLYGNVDIRQVSLAFKVSDRIIALYVEEGDLVGKDRLLAMLDTTRFQLALNQA